MTEIHLDRIDGDFAADGVTGPWIANTHLDRLFVLKARLTSELPIVNLGHFAREELEALAKQWDAVIGQAKPLRDGQS